MAAISFKSEFECENVKLGYNQPEHFFVMKLSCIPSSVIWWFRVLCTNYCIASFVYSIIYTSTPKWPVFLTNWSLVLVTVYFLIITIISGIHGYDYQHLTNEENPDIELSPSDHDKERSNNNQLTWYMKILWVWFNLAYVLSIVTYLMYWAFVFESEHVNESGAKTFLYINEHLILLCLAFIDLLFHEIPVRLFHIVYPLIVTLLYLLMSVIYDFAANDYIYKILDWENKAGWTLFYFVLAIVLEMIAHLFMYGIYRLKLKFKA